MDNSRFGIVIQVRTGSTRLPNKMILPFYRDWTVLDIILDRFNKSDMFTKVVVATTVNNSDDKIVEICANHRIEVFRGSENNVLDRFIKCGDLNGFDSIYRVCADNPFFDVEGSKDLILRDGDGDDYTSYKLAGDLPSIKSHLGFWGEIITLSALKEVNNLTNESLYLEHVTNYIYANPDIFNCNFVAAPKELYYRKDIRLTLDSLDDFKLYQEIYSEVVGDSNRLNTLELLNYIDNSERIKLLMKQQIVKYEK